MSNYETGGVKAPPPYLRDVFNKCVICGETWIGVKKAMCSRCISDDQNGQYDGKDPAEKEIDDADEV